MAISNERRRLAEYLAREGPDVVADYVSASKKLQSDLLDFYPELDIGALVGVLRSGHPEQTESARDYLDRYLEINAGKIPAGKLPLKVRWQATRDDGYDRTQKAGQSLDAIFKAVSQGRPIKAAFSVASLMYHASSASLSFLSLTKREKIIGTVVGANMAMLTAMWPSSEPNTAQQDIETIINSNGHTAIEETMVRPPPLEITVPVPVQEQQELTLAVSNDVVLNFRDQAAYDRAKDYLENPKYATYMGAPVSAEIRQAFVVGDAITPYPYEFWQGQGYAESTFKTDALNKATLARGIMQMTPETTLEILYDMRNKPQYSFIPEAQLVTKNFDKDWVASYSVKEGIDKNALVASVAYDPLKAVMVAAEFNTKYFALLQNKYPEQQMSSVHAYVLHWQGYNGSQKIFDAQPSAAAVSLYGAKSEIVQNHKTIFYTDPDKSRGRRSVESMLSHLQTNRGLGDIAIPKISEWAGPVASISALPQNLAAVEEKYRQSLAPLVSKRPVRKPESLGERTAEREISSTSIRPMAKPPGLNPG